MKKIFLVFLSMVSINAMADKEKVNTKKQKREVSQSNPAPTDQIMKQFIVNASRLKFKYHTGKNVQVDAATIMSEMIMHTGESDGQNSLYFSCSQFQNITEKNKNYLVRLCDINIGNKDDSGESNVVFKIRALFPEKQKGTPVPRIEAVDIAFAG